MTKESSLQNAPQQEEREKETKGTFSGKSLLANINWKNIIFSIAVAFIWMLVIVAVTMGLEPIMGENASMVAAGLCNLLSALALTIYAVAAKTSKAKYTIAPWAIFVAIMLVGPLGVAVTIYDFLQAKWKEDASQTPSMKKLIPWAAAAILALVVLKLFGFSLNNYCQRREILDAVRDLANKAQMQIVSFGAEKVARDGSIYYCEIPLKNQPGRVLNYTVHILDEGFWAELGHKFN